jgi:glutaredoxin 3
MSDSPILKVYVKPGCPWCVDVIAYLKSNGYRFEEIDVMRDPARFDEMRRLSGQSSAPTMTSGDLLLADFGVDELRTFLSEHGIQPSGQ